MKKRHKKWIRKAEVIVLLLAVFIRIIHIIFRTAVNVTIIPAIDTVCSVLLEVILIYFAIRYYQIRYKNYKKRLQNKQKKVKVIPINREYYT